MPQALTQIKANPPIRPPVVPSRDEWPCNYVHVWAWRYERLMAMRKDPVQLAGALEYYRTRPIEFIQHWCDTYDPRNAGRGKPAYMPFIMFQRQAEFIQFLQACMEAEENGLVEKARDMGATWVCSAFSVWLWRFYPGAAVGWGSRKEQLVDKLGDPDSIFEKMRILIRRLPREFWPKGFNEKDHMPFMRILNPENGATITGEAGDNIGRGGRKLIYFKDEAAHYERPEKIEAALADNTRVQIDISSVNGLGNVFHRRREAGKEWSGGEAHKGITNIFVMDWRDHPLKDAEWYASRKRKAEADGLAHVFAQEVDRNYAASVDGVIIPAEWISAAIDAHVHLGFQAEGATIAGLDVADEGGDRNALGIRKGAVLLAVDDWSKGDTGETTRKAVTMLQGRGPVSVQYDSVGVGAGVKSEANRLKATKELPAGLEFVPWSAGAGVQFPDRHIDPQDKQTPLNRDFYSNLKAQAWWELRRRFERTYRARHEGISYSPDDMISLPSSLPKLRELEKELAQATASRSTGALKLVVDKSPPGTRSPNLADAVVMAYYPVNAHAYTLTGAL
jgi:phage terminase large subunit